MMMISSLRRLAQRPAWAATAILTLALAIGASTAVFSVLDSILLKPLPYPEDSELVNIYRRQQGCGTCPVSRPDFLELEAENDSDFRIAGFTFATPTLAAEGEQRAERLFGSQVTREYFALFGLPPAAGRLLDAADDEAGAPAVVVISHALWQRRYAGDPGVIGRGVVINGQPHTVVGVTAADMQHPRGADAWMPLRLGSDVRDRGTNFVQMVGRLQSGVPMAALEQRLATHAGRWARDYPSSHTGFELWVRGLKDTEVGGVRDSLWLVMGAVLLVLAIACANVANMQLTRTLGRRRELATRAALGAGRWTLAREALEESLTLAALACLGGLALAVAGIELLSALAPRSLPRADSISLDPTAFGFAVLAALITGLACGALPALVAGKADVAEALRGSSKGSGGGRHAWRRVLVVAELGLSALLLVGATLMIMTLSRLTAVDPGFRTDHLLTAMVSLPAKFPYGTDDPALLDAQRERNAAFLTAVLDEVRGLPGVLEAGAIDVAPVTGWNNWSGGVQIDGREPFPPGQEPTAEYRWVMPGYFEAIGVALQRGVLFTPGQAADGPAPIMVNRVFAERLFPGADPIGQRIRVMDGQPHTIIGVVSDARQWGLSSEASPEVYFSYEHFFAPDDTTLVLRTSVPPMQLAEAVKAAVARVDAGAPVFQVRSMEDIVARSVAQSRFAMLLLTVFAVAASLVAAVGLYGVMSYTVAMRTHDIGVRMALGEARERVLSQTLREGVLTAGLGVAVGLVVAFAGAGLLASLVYGVSVTDPVPYLVAGVVLIVAAAIASLIPAWRAASVQPVEALRYE